MRILIIFRAVEESRTMPIKNKIIPLMAINISFICSSICRGAICKVRDRYEITTMVVASPFRYGPLCRLQYYNVTAIVEQQLIKPSYY